MLQHRYSFYYEQLIFTNIIRLDDKLLVLFMEKCKKLYNKCRLEKILVAVYILIK